jgi:CheY-like chemotaxis protein
VFTHFIKTLKILALFESGAWKSGASTAAPMSGSLSRAQKTAMQPILFIEPDPGHLSKLKNLLGKNGVINPSHSAFDFSQAMFYLKGEAPYEDRARFPIPAIIFLDIHLEGYIGFKLLQWLRRRPELAASFVVICSELTSIADLRKCYQFGAQTFLLKPYNQKELQNLLRHFPHLWQFGPKISSSTGEVAPCEHLPRSETTYPTLESLHCGEELRA